MFSIWIATLHSFQWFVLLLHDVVRPFGINRISTMSVKYSWLHRACCAMTKWVLWKACDQTATIRKIGELANFPWGIPQKGLGKVMIFLRLSGGIQYLSYTSSPLIFDPNIQQVEKNVCLRRAVLLTISSHNTRLPTFDLRGELLPTGQGQHWTWSCYPPPTKHSVPGQTYKLVNAMLILSHSAGEVIDSWKK